jgi:hypothetical protein
MYAVSKVNGSHEKILQSTSYRVVLDPSGIVWLASKPCPVVALAYCKAILWT